MAVTVNIDLGYEFDVKAKPSEVFELSDVPASVSHFPKVDKLEMEKVVAPVVESEFEKLVDKYIANLITRFGGEA